MEAKQMLRNKFSSNLNLPKSKNFPLAPAMAGPWVATEPWNFYYPEPLPLLP